MEKHDAFDLDTFISQSKLMDWRLYISPSMTAEKICAISLGLDPATVNVQTAMSGIEQLFQRIESQEPSPEPKDQSDEHKIFKLLFQFLERFYTTTNNTTARLGTIHTIKIESDEYIDCRQFVDFANRINWPISEELTAIIKQLEEINPGLKKQAIEDEEKPNHIKILGLMALYIWKNAFKQGSGNDKENISSIASTLIEFRGQYTNDQINPNGLGDSSLKAAISAGLKMLRKQPGARS